MKKKTQSKSEIKSVIFDLGNVLALHDARIAARRYAKITGMTFKEVWDAILTSKTEKAYTRGEITSYQFYRYAKGLAKKSDVKMSYTEFRDIWNEIFVENKGMETVLKSLKKNYPLYLISNTNAMHWNYLLPKYWHLLRHFRRRFPSHEVGARKPDPEIYNRVLKAVKLKPEHTVFIDDHPGFTEGAKSVGMHGIIFKNPSQLLRDLKKLGVQAV